MARSFPDFRPGNVLSTAFTGTLTERRGDTVERIPVPERLADWLTLHGLAVESCTDSQLDAARKLREAIHLCATAAATGDRLPTSPVRILNDHSLRGRASAILSPSGVRQWQLTATTAVEDALGVIAADAIDIVAGERDGTLALCASPTCRAAFFDTSQSRSRKWCDMNTCGNRQKKARMAASRGTTSSR
ncbi:ABATE domain-containing protein [Rhodococcus fascians]|jgi:predicted RNA-binding Zn ribbon-like protein|uniref:CGNR zinc finger domain-containing protein n=1 Tax=Rhodococcoides fascians TaxID=1828 RepID=UPI001427BFDA|nr:ABATE domain-containing protein [Rhodococcus fascians]MBY3825430.1 ABATE domain-containing protein [Rhodococcus fascians]MBY3835891.1 ABATE domain-containing protein [Rhodococcus fascians]MBY3865103.1 ABATE domain-containing protein [Rhodococcus fascians]MBY3884495.1 ABATE domain-containing protein [Rhodococcus fascians]